MPILRTKVTPLEQRDSKSAASKFIQFLNAVSFIAVSEKNGKLIFKLVSFKTLFNLLFVVICLYGFHIICLVAFEYKTKMEWHFGSVMEFLSFSLYSNVALMNLLQPLILRYVCSFVTYLCKSDTCSIFTLHIFHILWYPTVLALMIWMKFWYLRKTLHGQIIRKPLSLVRI